MRPLRPHHRREVGRRHPPLVRAQPDEQIRKDRPVVWSAVDGCRANQLWCVRSLHKNVSVTKPEVSDSLRFDGHDLLNRSLKLFRVTEVSVKARTPPPVIEARAECPFRILSASRSATATATVPSSLSCQIMPSIPERRQASTRVRQDLRFADAASRRERWSSSISTMHRCSSSGGTGSSCASNLLVSIDATVVPAFRHCLSRDCSTAAETPSDPSSIDVGARHQGLHVLIERDLHWNDSNWDSPFEDARADHESHGARGHSADGRSLHRCLGDPILSRPNDLGPMSLGESQGTVPSNQ